MDAPWTPLRWPESWTDPAALNLLQGTGIDCILFGKDEAFAAVRSQAEARGIHVVNPESPPAGVSIVKGEWPGVKMGRNGGGAEAGPTGVPWVDSNGWAVRLEHALRPAKQVWVDAPPPS